MSLAPIQDLCAYHRWANRRLFDVAAGLGEAACGREVGAHFSVPTLTRMFAHLYGADWLWLQRWKGTSPTALPGADVVSMAALRAPWDALETEQTAFVDALTAADLDRVVDYRNTEGLPFHGRLGVLLQHVLTHAVHHRSEIATMLTMISGSPPDTSLLVYHLAATGQKSRP